MKEIVKKGKLVMITLVLMVVIAGYINYEYNPEREKNLGQTIFVNSNDAKVDEKKNEVDVYSEKNEENKEKEKEKGYTYIINENSSIATFKKDRDNMFEEMAANYKYIIENEDSSKEMVKEYQLKLNELIDNKNLILMVENVIKSNGIDNIVIVPTNSKKLNVIIESLGEISQEDKNKITDVLKDEFNIAENNISIIEKKK